MESEIPPPSTSLRKSLSLTKRSFSGTCLSSVKCKHDAFEEENQLTVPGLVAPQNARVEIGNECLVLRETVCGQQQIIQDLISELEEERDASSSAATETMSMILRLQREKAEIQMEARQFKRFVEEKMAHDREDTLALEDLLYKREQAIQALTCEVQAYRHRMVSFGFTEAEANGVRDAGMAEDLEGKLELPREMYPPLKCDSSEYNAYPDGDDETPDIEKYAFGETPRCGDQLKDLEYRINQLERSPRVIQSDSEFTGTKNVLEKVIVGQSPRTPRHLRKFSTDGANSPFAKGREAPDSARDSPNFKKTEFSYIQENYRSRKMENGTMEVEDDGSDRVYTIDSVYQGASITGLMDTKASTGTGGEEYIATPKESLHHSDDRDLEIQKLYARLHALEADRESMRQSIASMGTDKAQMVLLREIAQNLCKDMSPARTMPVRKHSVVGSFFMSIFKWIISIIFWRRQGGRYRYMFGSSANNAGLLVLLDRGPSVGQWRCIFNTNV